MGLQNLVCSKFSELLFLLGKFYATKEDQHWTKEAKQTSLNLESVWT